MSSIVVFCIETISFSATLAGGVLLGLRCAGDSSGKQPGGVCPFGRGGANCVVQDPPRKVKYKNVDWMENCVQLNLEN